MTCTKKFLKRGLVVGAALLAVCALSVPAAFAACPAGAVPAFPGSDQCILDPLSINKYELPLVIPPVMDDKGTSGGGAATANVYDIAVRQFQQQILPGGVWKILGFTTQTFPATTVWSYGPDADPLPTGGVAPDISGASQFNYPAYTVETMADTPVSVRWINDLVDGDGNYLPHLLPIDQTLHWANPVNAGCRDAAKVPQTDCATNNPAAYDGPVPIVTHVHGAHVDPHSDGYPEAWWLPAANNIPGTYATKGTLFDDATGTNDGTTGYADYVYRQDQPATTLWYHDHSLGMTRSNVYAGPAGFWLVRGDYTAPDTIVVQDAVDDGTTVAPNDGILPGPAPVAGQGVLALNNPADPVRQSIREIPIVIQDRSFKPNGDLFYPDNRAFFEGLNVATGTAPTLDIPFVGDADLDSDIAPIWNPEAFFSVMVVNGVSWPTLEVAPALYRLRLLNGCNSRFLNLALFRKHKKKDQLTKEFSFFQVGAEQGFLPQVVEIRTGFATPLPGDGTIPLDRVRGAFKDQALLMGLAERADVIVDFRGLKNGDVVRMINTAPDAPFGGFPDIPADPATTGQVMQFVVNSALLGQAPSDPVLPGGLPNPNAATDPYSLIPVSEPANTAPAVALRNVSLNEGESELLCVDVDITGNVFQVFESTNPGNPVLPTSLDPATGAPCYDSTAGAGAGAIVGVPFAPKEALLGTVNLTGGPGGTPIGNPLKWTDASDPNNIAAQVTLQSGAMVTVNVTENPTVGDTEEWDIYNFTVDGHPIHLHLVRFEVIGRSLIGAPVVPGVGVQAWETGYKDTVIAYPGEITRVKALFDIEGLYVWHCHIVEHEDNEMMRPYVVSPPSP